MIRPITHVILALAGILTIAAMYAYAQSAPLRVIDGDTVASGGVTYRLIGFDTPETGRNAKCELERLRAKAATNFLASVIARPHRLERVPCACSPGTEGTSLCNRKRLCARLFIDGRDIAEIMIEVGLARRYVCQGTRCPRREGWCS